MMLNTSSVILMVLVLWTSPLIGDTKYLVPSQVLSTNTENTSGVQVLLPIACVSVHGLSLRNSHNGFAVVVATFFWLSALMDDLSTFLSASGNIQAGVRHPARVPGGADDRSTAV